MWFTLLCDILYKSPFAESFFLLFYKLDDSIFDIYSHVPRPVPHDFINFW